jgi:hypothetical protein
MKTTPTEEVKSERKQPIMTPTELMGVRAIYKEKLTEAVKLGYATKAVALHKRIDSIDIMLDSLLMGDMEAAMPTIRIDLNMFTMQELKKLMPGFDPTKVLMSGENTIDFGVVEDVESEEVVEEQHTPVTEEETAEIGIVEQLNEVLKKNFVAQIPEAIKLFRQITGNTDPDGIAWIKVSNLLKGVNRLLPLWYNRLRHNLLEDGSIKAFWQVKKNLKTWTDMDIAILLKNALDESIESIEDVNTLLTTRDKVCHILHQGPVRIKELAESQDNIDLIKSMLGIPATGKVKGDDVMKCVTLITNLCSPEKRAEILKRKPYVEKGYPIV